MLVELSSPQWDPAPLELDAPPPKDFSGDPLGAWLHRHSELLKVRRAFALENHPSPHNPLGAKGAGEGGIIPVAGVIANAVSAALHSLGASAHELPLSPSRLWHLIDAARPRTAA